MPNNSMPPPLALPAPPVALEAPTNFRAAPPRLLLDVDKTMRLIQESPSQDWNKVVELAMTQGLTEDKVQELLMLLVTTMKARGNPGIRATDLITVFTRLNVGRNAAKRHVHATLLRLRQEFPQSDMYFEMNGGNLDDNHFTASKITVFADGVNECLQAGDGPVQAVVRAIARQLFRMVCDQLENARRFDARHRSEEAIRIGSVRQLKGEIQAAIPALDSNSTQGCVRRFSQKKYYTLGICDGRTDGFKTAKDSLRSVVTTQQLDRRSTNSVADHFTIVGKAADAMINSYAAHDLQLESARIRNEADPKKQKTMMWDAMTNRQQQWKRYNMFAADPRDVGNPNAQLNPRDQARCYLDQSAELESGSFHAQIANQT
jgi:hypothetical protein